MRPRGEGHDPRQEDNPRLTGEPRQDLAGGEPVQGGESSNLHSDDTAIETSTAKERPDAPWGFQTGFPRQQDGHVQDSNSSSRASESPVPAPANPLQSALFNPAHPRTLLPQPNCTCTLVVQPELWDSSLGRHMVPALGGTHTIHTRASSCLMS